MFMGGVARGGGGGEVGGRILKLHIEHVKYRVLWELL